MCRWIAYRGETIALEHYVTSPSHSLIAQSLHALESTASTNGDGFGLGWYGEHAEPEAVPVGARGRLERVQALRNQRMRGRRHVVFERDRLTAIGNPAAHQQSPIRPRNRGDDTP